MARFRVGETIFGFTIFGVTAQSARRGNAESGFGLEIQFGVVNKYMRFSEIRPSMTTVEVAALIAAIGRYLTGDAQGSFSVPLKYDDFAFRVGRSGGVGGEAYMDLRYYLSPDSGEALCVTMNEEELRAFWMMLQGELKDYPSHSVDVSSKPRLVVQSAVPVHSPAAKQPMPFTNTVSNPSDRAQSGNSAYETQKIAPAKAAAQTYGENRAANDKNAKNVPPETAAKPDFASAKANKLINGDAVKADREYNFVQVEFDEGGNHYWYLDLSDKVQVGDFVIVPTGPENDEEMAEVVEATRATPLNAPYSIETVKIVLKILDEDEDY